MTTQKTNTAKNTAKTTLTVEERLEMIESGQERTAQIVGELDQRLSSIQSNVATEAVIDALAPAAKKNLLAGLKQTSTTRKVVIATVATAAVAGVGYAGYRGLEVYKDRKAAGKMAEVLSVAHVESPSAVSKTDAIRQGLGIK